MLISVTLEFEYRDKNGVHKKARVRVPDRILQNIDANGLPDCDMVLRRIAIEANNALDAYQSGPLQGDENVCVT